MENPRKDVVLRSVQSLDAGDPVPEAVHPQTGDVVIGDLHFAPGEAGVLVEVQLVIGPVLPEGDRDASITEEDEALRSPAGVKPTTLRGLRDRRA